MVKYPPPPYKIKMVEPIDLISKRERQTALKRANYNLFNLRADEIYLDFLTDSGTGAMSQNQWAAMMRGDETYANAKSFDNFCVAVQNFTGMTEVIPTHQGRAAENILIGHLLKNQPNSLVVSNQSFDTTVGHILYNKAKPVDILSEDGKNPKVDHPFKGNIDISKLESLLVQKSENIAMITLVLTNNAGGGQPVSIENIEKTASLAKKYNIMFNLDIARVVENAYFIQQREEGYNEVSLREIVQQICSFADAVWMSAKKDAFVNIGGFIALNDPNLADKLRERLILFEGFPTYGGLAGRDLEAIAVGLEEALEGQTVAHRVAQINFFVKRLQEENIPVVLPPGGHAAFIDAKEMLPHIPPEQFPGQALACELYLEGGIRSVEIGSLMFGRYENGNYIPAPLELVRLAVPRRVYTKAHFEYVVGIVKKIYARRKKISGMKIIEEPELLRHFTCKLTPLKEEKLIQQ